MSYLITHDYDKHFNVTGYDPAQGCVEDIKAVSVDLAYVCLYTGKVYM